jgi:hypothetical protein
MTFRRSPFLRRFLVVLCLILCWSLPLGWGLARADAPIGTVDPVPPNLQLGQEIYLENCASCHVGLPPAVMPLQTWRSLLLETDHYGAVIPAIVDPQRRILWSYLSTFSRPLNQGEEVPFRLRQSRFFKALHPTQKFDPPVSLNSCTTCHPAAAQFDYRSLSPEWNDAP